MTHFATTHFDRAFRGSMWTASLGALLFIALPAQAATCAVDIAGYGCTVITYPGAASTVVGGINNSGRASGYYQGASSGARSAYSYSQGAYAALSDSSGASSVVAFGINEAGDIAGYRD